MSRDATVQTEDLRAVLAYLDGLSLILRTFDSEQRGRDGSDPLIEELQALDDAEYEWAPLRYQSDPGQGWGFVDHNLADLRERLVESYGSAALDGPTP